MVTYLELDRGIVGGSKRIAVIVADKERDNRLGDWAEEEDLVFQNRQEAQAFWEVFEEGLQQEAIAAQEEAYFASYHQIGTAD